MTRHENPKTLTGFKSDLNSCWPVHLCVVSPEGSALFFFCLRVLWAVCLHSDCGFKDKGCGTVLWCWTVKSIETILTVILNYANQTEFKCHVVFNIKWIIVILSLLELNLNETGCQTYQTHFSQWPPPPDPRAGWPQCSPASHSQLLPHTVQGEEGLPTLNLLLIEQTRAEAH